MATTTKQTTIVETEGKAANVERQHVPVVEENVAAKRPMDRQTFTALAVISGLFLFMIGMGLGFLCGRMTNNYHGEMMRDYQNGSGYWRTNDSDGYGGGMMYRRYNTTQPNNSQTTPSTNPTTPQTQAN